ncbi:MAG: ribonuclease HII [Clostridia bacterium]|nr:ribonuclease HII [Clostridia bacterium]
MISLKPEEILRLENMTLYEKGAKELGYKYICGIDEAGRGPLAGDVFAAAVILPEDYLPEGLNDSKKLTAKKRESLFDEITKNAVTYGIASASVEEIEEINIRNASFLAMRRAAEKLNPAPDYLLIDGNAAVGFNTPLTTIVKGDSKSLSVAAASILAKVARDRYITELSDKYPEYNFAKHKGYGTKEHCEALLKYGPCEIHRKSFLKKILGENI